MTELNSIKAGDRVLVKIGRNLIECEVMEAGTDGVKVRSLSTGREFTTARVEEIVGRAEPPADENPTHLETSLEEIPAEEPADEKPEGGAPADEAPADENPAAGASEPPETSPAEMPAEAFQFSKSEVSRILETPPEEILPEEPRTEAPADGAKPRKKLSLLNAAIEVLRQEGRPLNTRDLVKLVTERGLWTPTGCRTPEQSLYGAFFLEIKNAEKPRVKKSAERGKFELA